LISALALIVTLCSLAVIYALLAAPFIAVLQIIVYAGAIMVLFLFVIMLLGAEREGDGAQPARGLALAGAALALTLVVQLGWAFTRSPWPTRAGSLAGGAKDVARVLFAPAYAYAFEATSVLILAALVGVILLARKKS
ncbi:MAG: NADH-quinone oxidoreductase subunit J, partial [Vicinamibacteria bacterium]|nr:NADH-quinone oxidoreductase subunit J [Vicinamibacteria bacterium]